MSTASQPGTRNQDLAVDYFCYAAAPGLRGALWPSFARALIAQLTWSNFDKAMVLAKDNGLA